MASLPALQPPGRSKTHLSYSAEAVFLPKEQLGIHVDMGISLQIVFDYRLCIL